MVDKTVDALTSVDKLENAIPVAVPVEQIFVVLKLKFPLGFSHTVRLIRAALPPLYTTSGSVRLRSNLPANVELGAGILQSPKHAAVSI